MDWRELAAAGQQWTAETKQGVVGESPVGCNPVALALMGVVGGWLHDSDERVQVAVKFSRRLVHAAMEPDDRQLLTGFFEAYMHLSDSERDGVWKVLEASYPRQAETVEQIWTPLHEKGFREGLAKGLAQGHAEVLLVLWQFLYSTAPIAQGSCA